MSVLVPNASMTVVRRATARGAFGESIAVPAEGGGAEPVAGLPASKRENNDGTWHINLDPSLWPVRIKDVIVDADTGAQFVVQQAQHITHPEEPDLAHVRTMAVEVSAAGAEPGGAEFVGRP